MEVQIEIPKKTFDLYTQGVRAFVHLPRDRHDELSKLKYRESVILVNRETGETFKQIFWFLYSFKEIERFIFLVFEWERNRGLFAKRRSYAINKWSIYSGIHTKSVFISVRSSPNYQQFLCHSAQTYSALMFISDSDGYVPPVFRFETRLEGVAEPRQSRSYVSVDTLLIKKTPELNDSKYWEVHSVFPLALF